jgi:pimeloyl-ACP methyl ester carboxylesterase
MRRVGVVRAGRQARAIGAVAPLDLALAACGSAGRAKAETTPTEVPTSVAASRGIASDRVQVIQTADGQVADRQLGKGPPLVLIMGLGGSIDDWEPAFVDALAARYRVIVFKNAGVGRTSPLPPPLTVTAMADPTSAFISALGRGRVDVLGWSMGGMIAQALTLLHPAQVDRLVLAPRKKERGMRFPCRPLPPPTPPALLRPLSRRSCSHPTRRPPSRDT